MRTLQVVKTSDGAPWAARQARVLQQLGVEVHVALPSMTGQTIRAWVDSGARLHCVDLRLPIRSPHRIASVLNAARDLVSHVQPDIIHSHFTSTTCTLRLALGKRHHIPRVYQVAGPLHLEHWLTRTFELSLAGIPDYWIGSSRCIVDLYRAARVPAERLFLSYYGWFDRTEETQAHARTLRAHVGASADDVLVGNINFMYAPKYLLGQTVGLKCHEDIIDALGQVTRQRPDVLGVFVGGAWGHAQAYERRLRERAWDRARDRIRFAGVFPHHVSRTLWPEFDVGVHVPLSENCGGVPEALVHGIPVIASSVGGLPEIVMEGRTGFLVPPRHPGILARKILDVLDNMPHARLLADQGRQLVRVMFDAERTGSEVVRIYEHILHGNTQRLQAFDPALFVGTMLERRPESALI